MNNLSPDQIITYITQTQPHLLALVMKRAKPYMHAIEERAQQLDYGTIDLTLTVRAGEVEKMELKESKVWLRPKP